MGLAETLSNLASYILNTSAQNTAQSITYLSLTSVVSDTQAPAVFQVDRDFTPYGPYKAFVGMYTESIVMVPGRGLQTKRSRQIVLAGKDLGVVPKMMDQVQLADGSRWQVEDIGTGPGNPTYLLKTWRMGA